MAPARNPPLALERALGAVVLVVALAAIPLGLNDLDGASALTAGLVLGPAAESDTPPLVVLLLRLFAWIPLGDLATRANLAAATLAAVAAVLLARLGQRLLRSLLPLPDEDEGPEEPEATHPAALVPQARALREDPTVPTLPIWPALASSPLAPPAGQPPEAWGWPAPHIRPVAPVAPNLRAPAPVPARRAIERDVHSRAGTAPHASGPRAVRSAFTPHIVSPTRALAPGSAPVGPRALESHETIALAGAVLCPLASLGLFLALTSSPNAALTLVLVLSAWHRLLPLERSPGTPRRGLALALLAGLALGADPVAPLFIWPPVLLCGLRWFREGERWPLAAPLAFAVGAAVAFVPLGGAPAPLAGLAALLPRLGRGLASGVLLATARELVGGIGVVAALIAAVGAAVLLVRRPRLFVFTLASADLALLLVAAQDGPPGFSPGSPAWLVLVVLFFAPLLLGLSHLASKLGPARGGAALALAVVATLWPALDGGARRWQRRALYPEALLERAEARLGPGVLVLPGSPQMGALLRYGQALGRRPDLQLEDGPPVQALSAEPSPDRPPPR